MEAALEGRTLPLGATKQRAVLAMLALDANRPVPADRLVEGLWGESPPPSAQKMVQLYISHLRKALRETDVTIETHGRGYQLTCAPEDVDVVRAERLVAAAAEGGAPNGHAREALELWHGAPLADVADEPFAAAEIRRCDELWLRAKELAIDADLAAGRHEDALGELRGLAAAHPLREHIQGQLMLALYRAGRQAEALDAYRTARARLVEEIGSEPGPDLRRLHEAILHHDPSLDAPARTRGERMAPPRRASGRRVLMALGAALAVCAIAVLVLRGGSGDDAAAAITENSVGLIDPHSGEVRGAYEVGRGPSAVAIGAGSVWVANTLDGTVTRIDRTTDQTTTIDVGAHPSALAFGEGSLWVVSGDDETVAQVDPAVNRARRIPVGGQPGAIAAGFGYVWVAEPREDVVVRIDLSTHATKRIDAGFGPAALAAGAGAVWVAAEDSGQLVPIEPRSGVATDPVNVGRGPVGVAVGGGAVWVVNRADGTLSRVDPATHGVGQTIEVGSEPVSVAAGADGVWVATAGADATVARVDPATGEIRPRIRVPAAPSSLAIGGGSLWVAATAGQASHRGGTLVVEGGYCAIDGVACLMDPGYGHPFSWDMLTLAYDGLVGYRRAAGAAGEQLVPVLAGSLPEPRDGGRSYVFTLRPGLRFADGQAVRATDVRASLERGMRISFGYVADLLSAIRGAADCDEQQCDLSSGILTDEHARTVTFRLSRPDATFLYKLAGPSVSIVPASTRDDTAGHPPPGTGPYRIVSLDADAGGRLVRNAYFRPWSEDARPAGFADEIVIHRREDPEPQIRAVERGSSDIMNLDVGGLGLAPGPLARILNRYPGRISVGPVLGTRFMFLNVREPPFDDLRVRRAVNFATDRARMVELANGPSAAEPACQMVPPSIPGAAPYCPYTVAPSAAGTWKEPDLATARRLISASGTRGMRVTVWTDTEKVRYGRYFTGLLRRLGYRTDLRVVDVGYDYFDAISDPDNHAQIGNHGWIADYPTPATFFDPIFRCPATSNPSGFCAPSLDRVVESAQNVRGPEAEAAWARAERRLTDLAPAVPLSSDRLSVFTSTRAGNVQQNPFSGTLLERVWVR